MRLREVVLVMGRDSLGEEFMVMVEGEVADKEVMREDNVRGIEWVGVIGEDEMGVLGEEMVGEGVGGGCWRGMGDSGGAEGMIGGWSGDTGGAEGEGNGVVGGGGSGDIGGVDGEGSSD